MSDLIQAILVTLRLLVPAGCVIELRVLNASRSRGSYKYTATLSGYYNDLDKLALDGGALDAEAAGSIYVTLNPVQPALLARAANRYVEMKKDGRATSDSEIVTRRWLPIDLDPERPAGISSTNAEHEAALARAREVRDWLLTLGFPMGSLVLADSGNGAHVLVAVDLPNDDTARQLVEDCLKAVAFRFTDRHVTVDLKVFNAARIWKLYGTTARKGDHTSDRPHRRAQVLEAPAAWTPVDRSLLERLAALAPPAPVSGSPRPPRGAFDLPAWLAQHNVPIHRDGPWGEGGHRWILNPCVWDPTHTDGAAYIVRFDSGAIRAGCHHAGCHGKDWHALRDAVEPNWRTSGAPDAHMGSNEHLGRQAVRLDRVPREQIRWLWKWYIALSKVCLLFGDPGVGKGLFLAWLTAMITTGGLSPDGQLFALGTVLWFTAEDGSGDTIRPRVEDLGGDLTRVHIFEGGFPLDDDGLQKVEAEVVRLRPDLVLLDPFSAYAGAQVNPNRSTHTRPIFSALGRIAAEQTTTIVVVHHPNKGEGNPLHRASGSYDMIAAPRSVILFGADPENHDKRAMIHLKSNLGPFGRAWGYKVTNGRFEWTDPSDLTAARVFAKVRDRAASTGARDFLAAELADGPRPVKAVNAKAEAQGISSATLRRARTELRVIAAPVYKDNTSKVEYWELSLPPTLGPDNAGTTSL